MARAAYDKRCEKCNAGIIFARGKRGYLPLQRVRTVYTVDEAGDAKQIELERPLYVSHFETCSDPDRFSRKGENRETKA